ncbi:hypothetical protein C8F04DRAFT_1242749 [Mycena alexandri]|uniref:Uncharacterized protein n=1 Tax=Mycena alexandri TaxID=1745969 RepID=A0AAD6S0X2_9AGAR|nr:hypothetical protein C8F04DRAFT_1242749 [Mycena alexandri]
MWIPQWVWNRSSRATGREKDEESCEFQTSASRHPIVPDGETARDGVPFTGPVPPVKTGAVTIPNSSALIPIIQCNLQSLHRTFQYPVVNEILSLTPTALFAKPFRKVFIARGLHTSPSMFRTPLTPAYIACVEAGLCRGREGGWKKKASILIITKIHGHNFGQPYTAAEPRQFDFLKIWPPF